MNFEPLKNSLNDCPNSKLEIKANNYNKTKTFNVQDSVDKHLSRVDSQNEPDVTENLDNIARKMGINQSNNNSRPTMKVKLNKLDRCSEEKLNEKDISKSFQIPNNKLSEVTISNKSTPKKSGFMSNIIRRLSISTPKILSKNRKSKSRRSKNNHDNVDNQKDEMNGNGKLANMDAIEDAPKPSPNGKSIKNILQKLAKRKGKTKIISEPPSSIESRPSLSSVVNHGLNYDTTTSCNDIYLNKISRNEFPNYNNCASVDCILDYAKQQKLMKHRESNSSTSEDLIEQEAKLNAGINPISNDVLSDEFPDLKNTNPQTDIDKISPLSIKTSEFKFESQRSCHSTISGTYHKDSNKVKLTLALYGYSNYGLSSSRLTSKSCMEFRSQSNTDKVKLSMENISMVKATKGNKPVNTEEKVVSNQEIKVENETISSNSKNNEELEVKETEVNENETKESEANEVQVRQNESNENNEQSNVVLRRSQRPSDIKLRKSREPSQTLVARSSMIMLVVAHNSPRNKVISNQLVTPNKDLDLNASFNGSVNIPAVKLNFESFSNKDPKSPNCEMSSVETNSEILPTILDGTTVESSVNAIENGFTTDPNEICNGNYFLNLVHKHENEILMKIDVVQKYLDTESLNFDDEVSGQLLVTIGKARLLLSEKMLQFKGLCENNIRGIIEENELPTLLSDLNGFWDMVFGQVEDIYKNFALVEKIRMNDWKMVPFEENEKPSTITPARSKRSTTSKTSIGSQRKSSATNTPLAMKKKQSTDTPTHSKFSSAEKRKNMMQFKLNQKANMVQNSDPNMNNDITFY